MNECKVNLGITDLNPMMAALATGMLGFHPREALCEAVRPALRSPAYTREGMMWFPLQLRQGVYYTHVVKGQEVGIGYAVGNRLCLMLPRRLDGFVAMALTGWTSEPLTSEAGNPVTVWSTVLKAELHRYEIITGVYLGIDLR